MRKTASVIILCSCVFLIAFILFYKWACMIGEHEYDLRIAGFNQQARPFNLEKTWYVWISFVLSQAFIQIYLLNFIFRKDISHEQTEK
jgi:hypothetical protein